MSTVPSISDVYNFPTPNMRYFDSHCHPYVSQFDADREEVLARMEEREVSGIVVGTDLEESRQAIALAESRDFLWASVGLHPTDNSEEEFDIDAYRNLAQSSRVVAIGECGLDYYRGKTPEEKKQFQKERFLSQLELSIELDKPLIIHCRPSPSTTDAHEDMLGILEAVCRRSTSMTGADVERLQAPPFLPQPPIIHFFTSTADIARRYLALGCYISFPGVITFADLDETVCAVPLDRILTETDSPYAAPKPYRGQRNEPVYVEEVVKKIAEIKNVSIDEVATHMLANTQKAFSNPSHASK